MTEDTKQKVILLAKIGVVGTLISIPIGVWAMNRWPDSTLKTAALLTAVGLATKEVMLAGEGGHA